MRCPQILHESVHGQAVGIVGVAIAVNGEVHYGQEGISIYALVLAHFAHGFIAKAQVDAERPKTLQDVIIVADDGDEFIVRLIHFLILHGCKITKKL